MFLIPLYRLRTTESMAQGDEIRPLFYPEEIKNEGYPNRHHAFVLDYK